MSKRHTLVEYRIRVLVPAGEPLPDDVMDKALAAVPDPIDVEFFVVNNLNANERLALDGFEIEARMIEGGKVAGDRPEGGWIVRADDTLDPRPRKNLFELAADPETRVAQSGPRIFFADRPAVKTRGEIIKVNWDKASYTGLPADKITNDDTNEGE